jgi:hypothetical protein
MSQGSDDADAAERRRKPRKPSGQRVWADPGGVLAVVDCRIIDINDDGAQVRPLRGGPLPQQFVLQSDSSSILGVADVVWREGPIVGVKFIRR